MRSLRTIPFILAYYWSVIFQSNRFFNWEFLHFPSKYLVSIIFNICMNIIPIADLRAPSNKHTIIIPNRRDCFQIACHSHQPRSVTRYTRQNLNSISHVRTNSYHFYAKLLETSNRVSRGMRLWSRPLMNMRLTPRKEQQDGAWSYGRREAHWIIARYTATTCASGYFYRRPVLRRLMILSVIPLDPRPEMRDVFFQLPRTWGWSSSCERTSYFFFLTASAVFHI